MFNVNLIIYYINDKSIYVSHWLETLAQSAGAEVVKKAALLAEGNEWIDSFRRFLWGKRKVWCGIKEVWFGFNQYDCTNQSSTYSNDCQRCR